MNVQVLDLDGSIAAQNDFLAKHRPVVFPARQWGPGIRLACSFGRFRRFERALETWSQTARDPWPAITCCGSGDFHHVSLALVRRLRTPINLVVLDNHPDWMCGVPFLHCGTWLYHAARLPHVHRIFHVGGDVDFDNYYQWMAPWPLLRARKIIVFPAIRRFQRRAWAQVMNEPLRGERGPVTCERVAELLEPFKEELARLPLYLSLDKDVMGTDDAVVNWDSGHLNLGQVIDVVRGFMFAAGRHIAGIDIVGDWSSVRLRGWLRHLMHYTEHPTLTVDAAEAKQRNARTNLALVGALQDVIARAVLSQSCAAS